MTALRNTTSRLFVLSFAAGGAFLLFAAPRGSAEECKKRICRKDYDFDGTFCRSESGLGWKSHYRPDSPICQAGWEVSGQDCVKKVCCEKPACKSDERYRDGFCYHGPSGIGGYRSHRAASCEPGWTFDRERGVCKNPDCALRTPGIVVQPFQPLAITGYTESCARKGGPLTIIGRGFGNAQGPNKVEIGGHGVAVFPAVSSWSDTRIVVTVPNDRRLEAEQWYYAGLQNDLGHWITNIDKTFTICP